ncbi:glycerate kinase [Petroclostridium sp. X23]|jgi:glycerate kinase|uniref:glycerate kinase n=1 Tax=Petroclostridium sp. X23 TaxID=3045146 RepID=UPI0024AE3DE3|nr:glycerate kinase [Petroclostridium sp. X23]WHH59050.1 glycerate kinase [Petroclostridium sp. X23]
MKILIAPDSFKGSNTTISVANKIEKGIRKVFPNAEVVKIPIADGGEGTVDALVIGTGGEIKKAYVTGPLGKKIYAEYGVLKNGTAVIEMAAASGLPLISEEKRNPLLTTTYGTGELIKAALDQGCKKIVIGIGGSATNDGGLGMAQALGVSFKDQDGNELGYGGGELGKLAAINVSNLDSRINQTEIIVACDVSNPLCGEKGASAVYGPQKGATPDMIKELDGNLKKYADIIKQTLRKDIKDVSGAGAAGGLGSGLMVFCNAQLKSGIETILDVVNIDRHLPTTDLVITGEGKIDGQSIYGKVPVGVGQRAKKYGVPVLAIVGDIGEGASAVYEYGVDGIMSTVNKAMPLSEAMAKSSELLEDAAERIMRIIKMGMDIS